MSKPYRLGGEAPAKGGPARNVVGRYVRDNAVPANPLSEVKPAANDQQTMSGWAPGIGQNTAPLKGQQNPFPPASNPATAPFKLK